MNKVMRRAVRLGKANQVATDVMVEVKCLACNGSGHYDHDGSPPCDSCNGTGKELRKKPAPAR